MLDKNRQACAIEIKITPEMIEAGENAIAKCDGITYGVGFFSLPDLAVKVYQAMKIVRIASHP